MSFNVILSFFKFYNHVTLATLSTTFAYLLS